MTTTPVGDALVHSVDTPCLACRYTIKGNQHEAWWLYCQTCGHFHRNGCPDRSVWKEVHPEPA